MNRSLLIAAFCILGFTLFLFSVRHTPGWPSGQEYIAGFLHGPVFIAAVVVTLVSLTRLSMPKTRGVAVVCILLCTPLFGRVAYFRVKGAERARWGQWSSLAAQVTPLLGEYYAAHPDRFRYLASDTEEVIIDGFPAFALKDPHEAF